VSTGGSRHFERILRLEGVEPDEKTQVDLDISTTTSILCGLKGTQEIVIFDFDYAKKKAFLYIGRVIRVNKGSAVLKTIDTDGCWDEDLATVRLDDMSGIRLRCEYIDVYSRHVRVRMPRRRQDGT
jgi:hypothetical protein